jgi:hypothetical protein
MVTYASARFPGTRFQETHLRTPGERNGERQELFFVRPDLENTTVCTYLSTAVAGEGVYNNKTITVRTYNTDTAVLATHAAAAAPS